MRDDELDDALRSSGSGLRSERGACPDALRLLQYASGGLPAEERAVLQEHIRCCGRCDMAAVRLHSASPARPWWKGPLPAYVLCAGLAIACLNYYFRPDPAPMRSLGGATYLDLNMERKEGVPEIQRGRGPVALAFVVPMEPDRSYQAVLNPGNSIVQLSRHEGCDAKGNCLLIWDHESIAPGAYQVTVSDDRNNRFHFPFVVR